MGNRMKPAERLTFEPMGLSVELLASRSVLDHAIEAGLCLRAECGGRGRCGKCRVTVSAPGAFSPPSEEERRLLGREAGDRGLRLACQAVPLETAAVKVPPGSLQSKDREGKTGIYGPYPVEPQTRRLPAPAPDRKAEDGDKDTASVLMHRAFHGKAPISFVMSPAALRQIDSPGALESDWTLVESGRGRIIAALPGRKERGLGAAVDLGTTTVALYLCDLRTGLVEASAAVANPQCFCGDDVISRIDYAGRRPEGLKKLRELAVEAVNGLLAECLSSAGARPCDVDDVVVCGNPAMQHILAGVNPASLGQAPYRSVFRFADRLCAADIGLHLAGEVGVFLFPVVSGFVEATRLPPPWPPGPMPATRSVCWWIWGPTERWSWAAVEVSGRQAAQPVRLWKGPSFAAACGPEPGP